MNRNARAFALSLLVIAAVGWSSRGWAAAPSEEGAEPKDATDHRLIYRDEWRRFELVDYVSTAVLGAAYFWVEFYASKPDEAAWEGPILFDEGVRDAWVGRTRRARNDAAVVSDILWYIPMAAPFVELAVVPLLFDDWNIDVAWQLTAMNLQAATVNALLTRSGHRFVGRARPDTGPCLEDADYDGTCFGGPYASFPSGHASAAFLGAGVACAHHANLPLYGGGFPDVAVCAVTTAMSVGNGIARIVADRHYASDVIVGAFVGMGTGFGMPVLLHYGTIGSFTVPDRAPRDAHVLVTPFASLETLGVAASGQF